MTSSYKLIQLTNTTITDVDVDAFIPYGTVTRRINAPLNCCNTFTVTSSDDDTLMLNDVGFYKVTYSLTGSAAEAGVITIKLLLNGTSVYSVSQYVSDATGPVSLTLPYTTRVFPNCCATLGNCPVSVQIQNTGVALTGVSSNLIVEKI